MWGGAVELFGWWLMLPVIAASVTASGVIYQKLIRPVVHGVQILLEYAEYLQNEIEGSDDSLKVRLGKLDSRLSTLDDGQGNVINRLEAVKNQVDGMDTTWSRWVFSHAREHAEIWATFARMGFDRRHHDDVPVYPSNPAPGDPDAPAPGRD